MVTLPTALELDAADRAKLEASMAYQFEGLQSYFENDNWPELDLALDVIAQIIIDVSPKQKDALPALKELLYFRFVLNESYLRFCEEQPVVDDENDDEETKLMKDIKRKARAEHEALLREFQEFQRMKKLKEMEKPVAQA